MAAPSPSVDIRANKVIRLRTDPHWLPEKFHNRSKRLRVSFRPTGGEKRLLRKKKVILPSEWAPKNRVVTYGPLEGARWDNDFMPHMRGIMDAAFFPSVEYIGNCKAPQTGSSAGAETLIGYIADRKPGSALITYPDRDTASKRSTDYLQPMFKKSPRLRSLLTGTADDLASLRIKLQTMLIYMGWAGSVTSLGNVSAKYLIAEEVDKWKVQSSKKEARNLKLFFERFRAFEFGSKCFLISTPTDVEGHIWVYMVKEAQVVFLYCIPCPECGQFHRMSDKYIDFGAERNPKIVEEQDVARYVFPCCGLMANDRVRIKALQRGVWYAYENGKRNDEGVLEMEQKKENWQVPGRELFSYLRAERPRKICFHSPGWVSRLVKHWEIAAAFLKGLLDPAEMHYYDNQIKAVAHKPFRQNRKEDVIKKLKDARPAGLVPGGGKVAALVAGVDTQKETFRLIVRAFGWGQLQPSWKIREDEVGSFEELAEALFRHEYKDSSGLYYHIHCAVIDSGGTKTEGEYSRTTEVYNFARAYPERVAAYKGASGRKANPIAETVIDTYPGTRTQIPGGVKLYVCDTHHFKDHLASKLRLKSDAPGAFLLDADTTDQYVSEMCAEYVNDKRLWVCPKNKPNHYWDCEVMAMIGAELLRIRWWPQPGGANGGDKT